MILVDSNVIIDVLSQDPLWCSWSTTALIDAANHDEIAINPIIYAEVSAGFAKMASLDARLDAASSAGWSCPTKLRSSRDGHLWNIAAGAEPGPPLCLLTRDARRYAGYFPKVQLIAPDRRA
jgi:hypothetical protein